MEENFAELLEQSLKTLNNGDKVTGIVTGDQHRLRSKSIWAPSMPAYIPVDGVHRRRSQRQDRGSCQGRRSRLRLLWSASTTARALSVCPRSVWTAGKAVGRDRGCSLRATRPWSKALSPRRTRAALVVNVKGIRVFVPASQTDVPKGGDLCALAHRARSS